MPIRRLFTVLLACGLAFAACGGDDDDGNASGGDDQARADAAITAFEEQLRDDGFEPDDEDGEDADGEDSGDEDSGEDDGADDFDFESAECQDFADAFSDDRDIAGQTATAESDSYVRGALDEPGDSEETVDGAVVVVENASDLDEMFELFDDERLGSCLEDAFTTEFEKQMVDEDVPVEISEFDVQRLGDDIGDRSSGLRVTGGFSVLAFEIPLDFAVTIAQADRTAVLVTAATVGDSNASADITDLTESLLEAAS